MYSTGGEISQGAAEAAVVPPVAPIRGGECDICQLPVGPFLEDIGADALGLEQLDDGLHRAVVVGIIDAAAGQVSSRGMVAGT